MPLPQTLVEALHIDIVKHKDKMVKKLTEMLVKLGKMLPDEAQNVGAGVAGHGRAGALRLMP